MMLDRRIRLTVLGLAGLAGSAYADMITWFPADRSVTCATDFVPFSEPPPVSESFTGPPGGSWQENAVVINEDSWGRLEGTVGQYTAPTESGLTCFMFVDQEFHAPGLAIDISATSASGYRAYFAVNQSTDLTLVGDLSVGAFSDPLFLGWGELIAIGEVELRRVGNGTVFQQDTSVVVPFDLTDGFDESHTEPLAWTARLSPGIYELIVRASVDGIGLVQNSMHYDVGVVLTMSAVSAPPPPPCAGDLDGDDDTDLLDFAEFQRCFSGPRP